MAKEEFIKTVYIQRRYSGQELPPRAILLFKSGITGKKRIVKCPDYNAWSDIEFKFGDIDKDLVGNLFRFPESWKWGYEDEDLYIFLFINIHHRKEKFGANDKNLQFDIACIWQPVDKDGKARSAHYSNIDYLKPRTEIDKKYAALIGNTYYPPFWEILKVGGTESIATAQIGNETVIQSVDIELNPKRHFNVDSYFLNNGAEIRISWSYDDANGFFVGGQNYSNNWGDEMSPYDVGQLNSSADAYTTNYEKTVQIWIPEDKIEDPNKPAFTLCTKTIVIGTGSTVSTADGGFTYSRIIDTQDFGFAFVSRPLILKKGLNGQPDYLSEEDSSGDYPLYEKKFWLTGRKTLYNRLTGEPYDRTFSTGAEDKTILEEILRRWQQKYKNSKLQIVKNEFGYYSTKRVPPTVEWLLPTEELVTGSGPSGASGASGPSASEVVTGTVSEPIKGSFVFDVTKKDIMFNPEVGELMVLEKEDVDPFIFEEEDPNVGLDPEYSEVPFVGAEESYVNSDCQFYSDPKEQERVEKEASKINEASTNAVGTDGKVNEQVMKETYSNYTPGKHKLDMVPGELIANGKKKIKCCAVPKEFYAGNNIKPINVVIAPALIDLLTAAKAAGHSLVITSGFRPAYGPMLKAKTESGLTVTADSQEVLYAAYKKNGKPLTAEPGSSRHGNGIAVDLNTGTRDKKNIPDFGPLRNDVYKWLIKNSWKFGFVRAVATEEWHFEFYEGAFKSGPYHKLKKGGSTTWSGNSSNFYSDLGIDDLKSPDFS